MCRYQLLGIFFLIINSNLISQGIYEEKEFIEFLVKSEKYENAIYAINNFKFDGIDGQLNDSLNYLRAISYFSLKKLDSSAHYFMQVRQPQLKMPSVMLASFSYSYLGQFNYAQEILDELKTDNENMNALKNFQMAGNYLLLRDTANYRLLSDRLDIKHYAMTNEVKTLHGLYLDMLDYKPKSYLTAGIMSALVPGAGKMYTGKTGEGIYSLLTNLILAGITYENYRKAGPTNYKTIFFGSMFATFYIGNIYGSVAGVKRYRNEYNHETNYRIHYHLHNPLRTFFF